MPAASDDAASSGGRRTKTFTKARITAPQYRCPLHSNEQTPADGFNATLCATWRPEQVQHKLRLLDHLVSCSE
jgi:hypothetical protein